MYDVCMYVIIFFMLVKTITSILVKYYGLPKCLQNYVIKHKWYFTLATEIS